MFGFNCPKYHKQWALACRMCSAPCYYVLLTEQWRSSAKQTLLWTSKTFTWQLSNYLQSLWGAATRGVSADRRKGVFMESDGQVWIQADYYCSGEAAGSLCFHCRLRGEPGEGGLTDDVSPSCDGAEGPLSVLQCITGSVLLLVLLVNLNYFRNCWFNL